MSPQSARVEARLLAGPVGTAVERRLAEWREARFTERLYDGDGSLWPAASDEDPADRLGWVELEHASGDLTRYTSFAAQVAADGFERVVLLGMGGSSLAPELFERTLAGGPGYPKLSVVDTTHPDRIYRLADRLDPQRTLFVVSSKSGTTAETASLAGFFEEWLRAAGVAPGERFVAISDPGSALSQRATKMGFRGLFEAPADVGGRYSAFTPFGLVPAALLGADVAGLLASGRAMEEACARPAGEENPGLELGAFLAELVLVGRNKLTLWTSAGLVSLPDWIEQLVAESTGKDGVGILPVVGEAPASPKKYGEDRLFVGLTLRGDPDTGDLDRRLEAVEAAGQPTARFVLSEPTDIGGELYRWEMAVAAAGAALGVQPFDQPDVELAKKMGRAALAGSGAGSRTAALERGPAVDAAAQWLKSPPAGGYLALQAFVDPTPEIAAGLRRLQAELRDRTGLAVTVGFGPRFLHSTGQLHKGGPSAALFLQMVDQPQGDLPIPGADYGFAQLIASQARGDADALAATGRECVRVDLGGNAVNGLTALAEALLRALA